MSRVGLFAPVVAIILILAGCGGRPDGGSAATGDWAQEEMAESPAMAVEGIEVSRGSILQTVEASGSVRGVAEAAIVSEAQGIIQSVEFELGDAVNEGDVLVRLDDTVARLNWQEARESYESARLDLVATERRVENGSASQAELTRARSVANGAEARMRAAQKTLDDHTITAPISGFVASKASDLGRGNYLRMTAAVARIVDLTSLQMEIAVGEQELRFLQVGDRAAVHIPACGDARYEGSVRSIAAGADSRTGSFPVIIEWDNMCGSVRSGMSASVTIATAQGSSAPSLIVPSAAIRNDPSGSFVLVAAGSTVERRDVDMGERLGDRVQIVSGLAEGEVIITSGLSVLQPGDAVEVRVRGRTGDVL